MIVFISSSSRKGGEKSLDVYCGSIRASVCHYSIPPTQQGVIFPTQLKLELTGYYPCDGLETSRVDPASRS